MVRRGIERIRRFGEKRNIDDRVCVMTGDVAQRKQRRHKQNIATVGGSGKGSISPLMQSVVKMANQIDNVDRRAVNPSVPCFLDQFVPEGAEVTL